MVAKVVDLRKGEKKKVAQTRQLPLPEPKNKPTRRHSQLKAKRRKVRMAITLGVIVALLAIAYGIHVLSYMPKFNIQKISITGVEHFDGTQIQTYVQSQLHDDRFHYLSQSNIFIYQKEAIEKGIVAQFPHVKTAFITRADPLSTEITVAVGERQPYAKWCAESLECYAMDDSGFIFSSAQITDSFTTPYTFSGELTLNPIGNTYLPGSFEKILALLRVLQQELRLSPLTIEKNADHDFTVHFTDGYALKASYDTAPDVLARNLQLVLQSDVLKNRTNEIEYIDLRFGNRVYYKFKGGEIKSAQ